LDFTGLLQRFLPDEGRHLAELARNLFVDWMSSVNLYP
jgi:hypothetical protein